MKTFITDNFLLHNETAIHLYHDFAKDMPIIDYHCHLPPKEIADDQHYRSITEMWLDGDHYKWRAIRSAGYSEEQITGHLGDPKFDKERFNIWADVLPKTLGNPLYHWTNLELLRYFGIDDMLTPASADAIYKQTNEQIAGKDFSAKNLIKKFDVRFIGTTDDPVDNLEHHKKLQGFECKVAPSWRPDKIIKIDLEGFDAYISQLASAASMQIKGIDELLAAIDQRLNHFKENGCTISDHGLDEFVFTKKYSKADADIILRKALNKEHISKEEVIKYKSFILAELGKKYSEYGWVMQLHIGAMRNNNSKMFNILGADVGFDSINDGCYAPQLSAFLDTLNSADALPKTVLYCLNPRDNEMLGSMIGDFQGEGKMQFGSGWWFNDQKDGMERQMTALANTGLLSQFVGMLTDSRSFLSFSRHEYFRRILCNMLGTWVSNGEAPNDSAYLGGIVQDICYNNAKKYFNL